MKGKEFDSVDFQVLDYGVQKDIFWWLRERRRNYNKLGMLGNQKSKGTLLNTLVMTNMNLEKVNRFLKKY